MKLTAMTKLLPNNEQLDYLYQTLERANTACNWISEQAWEHKTFNNIRLHHLVYKTVRTQFELGSQMAVRCIGKVAEAYKKDKQVKRQFKKLGSIPYDSHNLTIKTDKRQVTLWTVDDQLCVWGAAVCPFTVSARRK
jgi:putative transposase